MSTPKIFLFTECYSCGPIAKKCLESFIKYHPDTIVNLFGTLEDFKEVGEFENIHYITVPEDVKHYYKQGHLGTAFLWAKIIQEYAADYNYVVHIDSDVIFRKEALSLIYNRIEQGYDLVGPVRCYRNNLNGSDNLRSYPDITQTYFFGFNRHKISSFDFETLVKMIQGHYNPLGHPVLDFFDPVSFNILHNEGSIFILNEDLVGGISNERGRVNKYEYLNQDMDFGEHLFHFAGIGTGMRVFRRGVEDTPTRYAQWALARFALYYKLFYDIEVPGAVIDEDKLQALKNILNEANTN